MHDTAPSVITAWSNFYVITGSSAAALTGLMFVVITLVAGARTRAKSEGIATFSTPTVVHFCVALLIAATMSAPWRTLVPVSVFFTVTGLCGLAYTLHITHRARRNSDYRPQFEDWIWYSGLPIAAFVAIVIAAIRLPGDPAGALFVLAGSTIVLIFIGIHNAWDVVTYLAAEEFAKPEEPAVKPSPSASPDAGPP
jgi:hypothetical protein